MLQANDITAEHIQQALIAGDKRQLAAWVAAGVSLEEYFTYCDGDPKDRPLTNGFHLLDPVDVFGPICRGCPSHQKAPGQSTHLLLAVQRMSSKQVKMLLRLGANPNSRAHHGWSVLEHATCLIHFTRDSPNFFGTRSVNPELHKIIQLLLKAGASTAENPSDPSELGGISYSRGGSFALSKAIEYGDMTAALMIAFSTPPALVKGTLKTTKRVLSLDRFTPTSILSDPTYIAQQNIMATLASLLKQHHTEWSGKTALNYAKTTTDPALRQALETLFSANQYRVDEDGDAIMADNSAPSQRQQKLS